MSSGRTTHVAIHHDPEGRCNQLLIDHGSKFRELFVDSFVITTIATKEQNPAGISLMESAGMKVIVRPTPYRSKQLDTGANIALVAGCTRGQGDDIFFGCLDRTLHMLKSYPDELSEILQAGLGGLDYTSLGRTHRAFMTHPEVQREPEAYTNQVTARLLGVDEIDVATGCRFMTKDTAREIIKFFSENNMFTNRGVDISDSYWPFIVKNILGGNIGFIRTEGLEFETPDQFSQEIEKLGYDEWVRINFDKANLDIRWERARETERVLTEFAKKFNPEGINRGKER